MITIKYTKRSKSETETNVSHLKYDGTITVGDTMQPVWFGCSKCSNAHWDWDPDFVCGGHGWATCFIKRCKDAQGKWVEMEPGSKKLQQLIQHPYVQGILHQTNVLLGKHWTPSSCAGLLLV
eukprot:10696036-Ditylum_brightwellii.AAC.1